MATTRITVCQRGHRLRIEDGPDRDYENSVCTHDTGEGPWHGGALCDYCRALVFKQRPAKAKRPGES